jgi:shikimate dehydrogenase
LPALLRQHPDLKGLNVTIPHKQSVIPLLDDLDETARAVGAVNCIKIGPDGRLKGYNTDVTGFEQSLLALIGTRKVDVAYILGTGGAAKAVAYVLDKLAIPFHYVSRSPHSPIEIPYANLAHQHSSLIIHHSSLIINCTPLGTFPNVDVMPPVPVEMFKPGNLVFDLVYNPAETLLLREAKARGCSVQNGLEMLYLQAEAAWQTWQT